MISQTTEYALRVVVHLAGQDGVPQTTRQIAIATRIPEGYLSKVLQGLSRAGMIRSQRGLHGGSVLVRHPEVLTIYEIVQATDPLPRIRSCPLGIESHGTNLCPLHRRLDAATAQVERAFKESTIADLLAEPTSSAPLCEVPPGAKSPAAKPTEKPARLTVSAGSRAKPARRGRKD